MKIPNLIEINKYVYGTYSAMALMNIQTVLNHIKKMAIAGLRNGMINKTILPFYVMKQMIFFSYPH